MALSRDRSGDQVPDDPLVPAYLRRLALRGASPKGIDAYRYGLRCTWLAAAKLARRPVTMGELFMDERLLGRALVDDVGVSNGRCLSRWTLAQRRSAVRSFADLMRPELVVFLGTDPRQALDLALRGVAERVGTGYRLTGGVPRRRGGPTPTADEIKEVVAETRRAPGFAGYRNLAFFSILAATGTRVNALVRLDGAECVLLPSGRLRLFLHEKGKLRQREVELSAAHAEQLLNYIEEYNLHASLHRWKGRVRLGEPGPIWQSSRRGRWSYGHVLATLRDACVAANVPPFTPHGLRRAFATDAASMLPRHVVALAGGWHGLERLDDHYVQPRQSGIWEKLRHDEPQNQGTRVVKDAASHAAAIVSLGKHIPRLESADQRGFATPPERVPPGTSCRGGSP